ncbi:hypothetical protein ABC628_00490 [Lentilactobacillus otakiensis]|uniref:AbrB family transcriptional regulator n=1 Tax=Lentilactobacillus otakiensis DSM 19908 = JCM 15040 TaxID=1423780 RepID=S4NGM2_9LACO|nr:hypothetical protein [Lentilactobacillus otakiensis]KRL10177.1 hypothetical protein FD05_GL000296 [Lentilactobacillus otakiensis DSM 19908 = JCM 15040]MBZ3777281.1 hypothetical protein [Lentilactobacillus otakiensis]MDV3518539.1 hypothetical protein [Lentilactobacillus otakiensis]GAD16407.1 hypothetical protein LOT_0945 [Lentilactobacillus otakiensis DSM 19908 = JCM 15040]
MAIVEVQKIDGELVLPVPVELKAVVGTRFEVSSSDDGKISYTPVHQNIFEQSEWQNYDYQKDMAEDPELKP